MTEHKEGDLRVWHMPQILEKTFYVNVPDIKTAIMMIKELGSYDLFLYEHRFRSDYANTSGLEVFNDGEWREWVNLDDGDINDYMRQNNDICTWWLI